MQNPTNLVLRQDGIPTRPANLLRPDMPFPASPAEPSVASCNRLLAALPPEDLARLWPRLRPVELTSHQVLNRPEEPVTDIFFPETGCVSRLAYLQDGDGGEIGLIGPEGMVGLAVLFDHDSDSFETRVQIPGVALQMEAGDFREELDRIPALRTLMHRYALAHFEQVARTAVCNLRHVIVQRVARRILTMHDQVPGDEFPLTQEVLAMLLGVRRAGVTVAASALQKAGFIHYARGQLTVVDRAGLESASCECYHAIRGTYARSLPRQA